MIDKDLLTLYEIKDKLKDRRLHVVAKATGLSYPTIKKLADEENPNCTIETQRAVSNYIKGDL